MQHHNGPPHHANGRNQPHNGPHGNNFHQRQHQGMPHNPHVNHQGQPHPNNQHGNNQHQAQRNWSGNHNFGNGITHNGNQHGNFNYGNHHTGDVHNQMTSSNGSGPYFNEMQADLRDKDLVRSCIQGESEQRIRQLIDCDANYDRPYQGMPPIMWAAKNNHDHVVAALLEGGARSHVGRSPEGFTLLQYAAKYNNKLMVEALLKYHYPARDVPEGRGCNLQAIHIASNHPSNDQVLKMLLEHSSRPRVDERTVQGDTALGLAAAKNNVHAIDVLLKHRADMECVNAKGETVLLFAIREGRGNNVNAIRKLLDNGADPSPSGSGRQHAALGYARQYANSRIADLVAMAEDDDSFSDSDGDDFDRRSNSTSAQRRRPAITDGRNLERQMSSLRLEPQRSQQRLVSKGSRSNMLSRMFRADS